MRIVVALGLLLILVLPGFAVRQKKRRSTGHKPTAAVSQKAPARKSAGAKSGKRLSAKSRGKTKMRQTWRTGQMTPTPDRYRQIQQALVAKGYSNRPPDGVWGPEWVGSLKKFQQDQKLEPNGKLTALSIKTLGLGAQRENAVPAAAPANPSSSSIEAQPKEQP